MFWWFHIFVKHQNVPGKIFEAATIDNLRETKHPNNYLFFKKAQAALIWPIERSPNQKLKTESIFSYLYVLKDRVKIYFFVF
jgi:hypothetical protein